MSIPRTRVWLPLIVLMSALLLWAIFHAVGTYQTGGDVRKPIIVLTCSLIFLGGWALLLIKRIKA